MVEIAALVRRIQTDKNAFQELLVMMEPLIGKYTRLLYKDEKEDVRAEMALALWEAVTRIQYCENDGECMIFLRNALKNRFYELYRKSRKTHDHQIDTEDGEIFDTDGGKNAPEMDGGLQMRQSPLFILKRKRVIG